MLKQSPPELQPGAGIAYNGGEGSDAWCISWVSAAIWAGGPRICSGPAGSSKGGLEVVWPPRRSMRPNRSIFPDQPLFLNQVLEVRTGPGVRQALLPGSRDPSRRP